MGTMKPSIGQLEGAHIGKSVLIKGELSGSEDLYLDGEVEGRIELRGHALTVGPNGRVRANIQASQAIVHGKVEGNIVAAERVDLKKSASVTGDIATARIIVEDGAFFKGGIDIQRESTARAAEHKPATAPTSTTTTAPSSSPSAAAAAQTAPTAQGSLIKK